MLLFKDGNDDELEDQAILNEIRQIENNNNIDNENQKTDR